MEILGKIKQDDKDLLKKKKKQETDAVAPQTHRTVEAASMQSLKDGPMTDEEWLDIKSKGKPTSEQYAKRYDALLKKYDIKPDEVKVSNSGAAEVQTAEDPKPAPAKEEKKQEKQVPSRKPKKAPKSGNTSNTTSNKGNSKAVDKPGTSGGPSHRKIEETSMKDTSSKDDATPKGGTSKQPKNWANNNIFNGGEASASNKPKADLRKNIYSDGNTKGLTVSGGVKGSWQKNNRFSDEEMKKKKKFGLSPRDYSVARIRRDYFERDTDKAGF